MTYGPGHAHTGYESSGEASKRTGILNATFGKDTMTPVRHAANDLDTACPVWGWCVWGLHSVTEIEVEALPKLLADPVPLFTVRMI